MPPHPAAAAAAASGMPFGLMPPSSAGNRGAMPNFPTSSVAAAYSNAYTNTLSVAASQAASLGIPAASKSNAAKGGLKLRTHTNMCGAIFITLSSETLMTFSMTFSCFC